MFSNINPFICSNMREFEDERKYLREKTYVRIRNELENLNFNFDPVEINWNENEHYVKSGYLLRLLLYNIRKSNPFFLCLIGQQYGPYLDNKDELEFLKKAYQSSVNSEAANQPKPFESQSLRNLSWLAKNILIASQTGYDATVNPSFPFCSLLEYQVNTALENESNQGLYRFYYRQSEYFDDKYMHLSIEERKKMKNQYEAENEFCEIRVKELKMRIAKKGLVVKYYKSLEQLGELVFQDFIDIVKNLFLASNHVDKPKSIWMPKNLILDRIRNYTITDSILDLIKNLTTFCEDETDESQRTKKQKSILGHRERDKSNLSVQFKLKKNSIEHANLKTFMDKMDEMVENEHDGKSLLNDEEKNEDYLEILRLRHLNLNSASSSVASSALNPSKEHSLTPCRIFLIVGPRGQGKTAFLSFLYNNYTKYNTLMPNLGKMFASSSFTEEAESLLNKNEGETDATSLESERLPANSNSNSKNAQNSAISQLNTGPIYLFYFMKPEDSFQAIVINIIYKLRLRFSNIDSSESLNLEFNDKKALIEQFHAALSLGPAIIFIDGMSELVNKVKFNDYFPADSHSKYGSYNFKFILTLRKSADNYTELANHNNCQIQDLNAFTDEIDYLNFFAKCLHSEEKMSSTSLFIEPTSSHNILYNKFYRYLNELKNSRHGKNPLYLQLIAQELFTFDKVIYKTHPIYTAKSPTASQTFGSEQGQTQKNPQVELKAYPSILARSLLAKPQSQEQSRVGRVGSQLVGSSVSLQSNPKQTPLTAAFEKDSQKSTTNDNDSVKSEPATGEHENLIDSYIEEVTTLREIIQKIFSRYIVKKCNWSTNASQPLSIENFGWIGDTLCLIALSPNGISKRSLFNILRMRGYADNLEVTDFAWSVFRMLFGSFIYDGSNGLLQFSHDYFKEAVQTLLLNGFSFIKEQSNQPTRSIPASKRNISEKQKEIHSFLIVDTLQNRINKCEFDFSSQVVNKDNLLNKEMSCKYLELIHELIYHVYMIYDLINLCKLLTSFKVIQIYLDNRMDYPHEWCTFINYMKLTTNPEMLRQIVISSITIGIPRYAFVIEGDNLFLNVIQPIGNEKENTAPLEYRKNSLVDPSKKYKFNLGNFTNLAKYFNDKQQQNRASPARTGSSNTSYTNQLQQANAGVSIDLSEAYEPFIDNLLDLDDKYDLSKYEFGDSTNMIIINRSLVLISLIESLQDKYFIENFLVKFMMLTCEIVEKNYPLDDNEKFKYSQLLYVLGNLTFKLNNLDYNMKYSMKSLEILEELYETFDTSNLDRKFKTKLQLAQINNQLSILNSKMAFSLLKLNDFDNCRELLARSKDYFRKDSARLKKKVKKLEEALKMQFSLAKFDYTYTENKDQEQLIYNKDVLADEYLHFFARQPSKKNNASNLITSAVEKIDNSSEFSNNQSSLIDAKFNNYFISGLLEVQSSNFGQASQFFYAAVSISNRWYGEAHLNTSRIYHYYGCFYSLTDTEFYSPRRAELYLRKALHIVESNYNMKKASEPSLDKDASRKNLTSEPTAPRIKENLSSVIETDSTFQIEGENESAKTRKFTINSQFNNMNTKILTNEEHNIISEILFDLGNLLITHDSYISKREAIDCLRHSLDIKLIILGIDHSDCKIIKSRLVEMISESSQHIELKLIDSSQNLADRSRARSSVSPRSVVSSRATSAASSAFRNPSRLKLLKITKENSFNSSVNEKLDALEDWINDNSIINVIPSKHDMKFLDAVKSTRQYEIKPPVIVEQQPYAIDASMNQDDFLESSIYSEPDHGQLDSEIDKTSKFSSKHNLSGESKNFKLPKYTELEPQLTRQLTKISFADIRNIEQDSSAQVTDQSRRAKTSIPQGRASASRFPSSRSTHDSHSKRCRCPTAVSIDVHNTYTVNGPNSSLKSLLRCDPIRTSSTSGLNSAQSTANMPTAQKKVLKHIYYKSAWYDWPPGSSKSRFKNFVKLEPNATH